MKLTNRRIKRILANAPDEATHYDTCCDEYLNYDVDQAYTEVGWVNVCIDAYADPSKLSDLEKILELRQRVQELEGKIKLMRKIVDCVKPDPKNPDGVSIEDADGYEWLQVILELNKSPKEST